MKTEWTPKTVLIAASGLIAVLYGLPKLGDGLDYARKVLGTTEVAYAAKEQVEQVDSNFQQYLQAQRELAIAQQAQAEALNAYVAQQQQQQHGIREWDDNGVCWQCASATAQDCYDHNLWERCR